MGLGVDDWRVLQRGAEHGGCEGAARGISRAFAWAKEEMSASTPVQYIGVLNPRASTERPQAFSDFPTKVAMIPRTTYLSSCLQVAHHAAHFPGGVIHRKVSSTSDHLISCSVLNILKKWGTIGRSSVFSELRATQTYFMIMTISCL